MILNTAEKSATAGRQATSETADAVDTSGKFATGSLIQVANHLFIRIFATIVNDISDTFVISTTSAAGANNTGGK
jgi:hypothetical protein